MDSVLEKITLYDILGYLFPGCVLLLICLFGIKADWTGEYLEQWKDSTGIVYFAFFLASYLLGIVLSEMTEWVLCLFRKMKHKSHIMSDTFMDQLAAALKKSGVKEQENDIREKLRHNGEKEYMYYMYGMIQSSSEYKRIHNYASAYILYKNMTAALITGMILLHCTTGIGIGLCCGLGLIIFLLLVRSYRFNRKKERYTIIWFMKMFSEN